MPYKVTFNQFNAHSILVKWPERIDEHILFDVLKFKKKIKKINIEQKVEVTHTYNSILIIYKNSIDNFNTKFSALKQLYSEPDISQRVRQWIWEIPVCYHRDFGVDNANLYKANGLNHDQLVQLHTAPFYRIYFLGFLPGFPYLGGLNSKLHIARKAEPNLYVKKGSVAIGGKQTGIYTQDSPGGWHVIGKTPLNLFDPLAVPPSFLVPGDLLKFRSISMEEFYRIEALVKSQQFELKPIKGE